jgi:transcriptional regulator with XRE-family HTH domain
MPRCRRPRCRRTTTSRRVTPKRVDTPEDLGNPLRAARRRRGLTQQHLADIAGASRDWVNRVDRGHAPGAEVLLVLRALASVGLTVSVEESPAAIDLDEVLWQTDVSPP